MSYSVRLWPWNISFPMEGGQLDRHHLGKLMWDVLQKHGIDHRKLGRRTKLLILSKVSKT